MLKSVHYAPFLQQSVLVQIVSSIRLLCSLPTMVHITVSVRATGVEDSRRFLRELDEAPGGNNLHYILQCLLCPCIGNQGLNKESALGGNGVLSK